MSSQIETASLLPAELGATRTGNHLEIIQSLRGIAAFAVVWFHFTYGNSHFPQGSIIKNTGKYGELGVDIFFVISGFILPYSMHKAKYVPSLSNYLRFVWKRLSRLDPPYIVSIAIIIALAYASVLAPGFRGSPPTYSLRQILGHFAYMNVFLGAPWLNVVYWSLAIEFQYYLLIGLLFPFLCNQSRSVRMALLGALGLTAALLPSRAFVFHYFFLFIMGFAVFLSRTAIASKWEALAILTLALAGTSATLGYPAAVAGILGAIAILTLKGTTFILAFLGDISYSLYLIHVPIGFKIFNLGERISGGWMANLLWLALAIGLSVAVAYALVLLVERPCSRYASSFRFQ